MKIIGVLLILSAALSLIVIGIAIVGAVMLYQEVIEALGNIDATTAVIYIVEIVVTLAASVVQIILGVSFLRNMRRRARYMLEFLLVSTIISFLCEMMLTGLNTGLISYFIQLIVIIVAMVYIDPALSQERALQRKLRKMETRERAEEDTLGRDMSGKGYIELDFFNIFWIFVVACILGLIIETIYFFAVAGYYQDRAGMLYGPFSPIYGFGAVLMTVALNRFHDRSIVLIFFISAIIGGAFEFAVSWFLEFAFGITAWDYTGTFLSIDGRTNFAFMVAWGILGCFWIKLCLPYMLKLINLIPWNWRYTVTTVCAALMIVNGVLTLASFDCWYQRLAGKEPDNALEHFCAEHYDNDFMQNRFQTMSIDPNSSTRTD